MKLLHFAHGYPPAMDGRNPHGIVPNISSPDVASGLSFRGHLFGQVSDFVMPDGLIRIVLLPTRRPKSLRIPMRERSLHPKYCKLRLILNLPKLFLWPTSPDLILLDAQNKRDKSLYFALNVHIILYAPLDEVFFPTCAKLIQPKDPHAGQVFPC